MKKNLLQSSKNKESKLISRSIIIVHTQHHLSSSIPSCRFRSAQAIYDMARIANKWLCPHFNTAGATCCFQIRYYTYKQIIPNKIYWKPYNNLLINTTCLSIIHNKFQYHWYYIFTKDKTEVAINICHSVQVYIFQNNPDYLRLYLVSATNLLSYLFTGFINKIRYLLFYFHYKQATGQKLKITLLFVRNGLVPNK